MKKGILVGILLVLVVGGYFAGTKLFQEKEQVTENQEKKQDDHLVEEKKVPRIVKVNGILYYDTGKLSTIEGRCGMPDDYIYSTVLPNEIPESDNESNFGSGYGFQYETENTIAMFLPTGWTVFSSNEVEADMDTEKNYVTIQDGKIDSQKLVEQFLERVGQNYEAQLMFYNEDNNQFYRLSRTRYDIVGKSYTNVEHGYEYQFSVDSVNEHMKYFYQFKTLDTTNGMVLRENSSHCCIEYAGNVVEMHDEEFIIY